MESQPEEIREDTLKIQKKLQLEKLKRKQKKTKTKTKPKKQIEKIFEYLNEDYKIQWEISDDVKIGSSVTPFQSVGKSPAVDKTASDFDNVNLKVKKIRRLIE